MFFTDAINNLSRYFRGCYFNYQGLHLVLLRFNRDSDYSRKSLDFNTFQISNLGDHLLKSTVHF